MVDIDPIAQHVDRLRDKHLKAHERGAAVPTMEFVYIHDVTLLLAELRTLRALRDTVEAARLAWGLFDDDGTLMAVDFNDQCQLPQTGHVRCVRVLVPAGDTP